MTDRVVPGTKPMFKGLMTRAKSAGIIAAKSDYCFARDPSTLDSVKPGFKGSNFERSHPRQNINIHIHWVKIIDTFFSNFF